MNPLQSTVVLAPISGIGVWGREFPLWAGVRCIEASGTKAKKLRAIAEARVSRLPLVTNYESCRNPEVLKALLQLKPSTLVLDESTKVKTPTAKVTKAVRMVADRCDRVICLSGTPVANSPLDLWSQVRMFQNPPMGLRSWYAMRETYAVMGGYMFKQIVGYRHLDDLAQRFDAVGHRATKADALDLPAKVYETVTFDLSPKERKAYKTMAATFIAEAKRGELVAANALSKILRLSQITSGWAAEDKAAKLAMLADLLEVSPPPLLVWARFHEDVDRIVRLCKRLGLSVAAYDGRVAAGERKKREEAFRAGDLDVLVGHPAAGGMALQLERSCCAIYYSNSYSWLERTQSEDRVHRIGQNRTVTIYDLVARSTVDEAVLKALKTKADIAKEVMADPVGWAGVAA